MTRRLDEIEPSKQLGVTVRGLIYLGMYSWLGCQVLLVITAVSIMELGANSGSSRMSWAPTLHIAMQLFNDVV